MTGQKQNKIELFLDTSVARARLLGISDYQEMFEKEFNGRTPNVSSYVVMEFRRSLINNLISFFFLLEMDHIQTLGEAFEVWHNKFEPQNLKAAIQIINVIFNLKEFDLNDQTNKAKGQRALADAIWRIEVKFKHYFKLIQCDKTKCARGVVPLRFSSDLSEQRNFFRTFQESFCDIEACRKKCIIDTYFLKNNRTSIDKIISESQTLGRSNPAYKIGQRLQEIIDKNGENCTCNFCGYVGDSVIAIDMPQSMRLEHIDNSFDYLCEYLQKKHKKYPSEMAFVKSGGETPPAP